MSEKNQSATVNGGLFNYSRNLIQIKSEETITNFDHIRRFTNILSNYKQKN